MISENDKKLAQWTMDFALKNGCQSVKVILSTGSSTSFELRDAKMDKLQRSSEREMSISLYVDERYSVFSTNRLDKKELESFIKNGIDSTRYLAKDEFQSLANPSRYYKGGKPDLLQFDEKFSSYNPDDKIALAKATAEEILGKDKRIISVESSYSDGENFNYRLASNGFEGESKNTWYSLSASSSVKGEGDARPSSYWYESSLYFDKLIKENIGRKALERTLLKLGQKKMKSGKYTMVVDFMNSSRLISPMINALSGYSLQQKNSFLLNKLGEKIGSEKFNLIDDPHLPMAFGARYFDEEGVATQNRSIYENGVLKTYFIDTYISKKMKIEPTISNSSILILQPGTKNLDELIVGIDNGILVTGFNGGNSNNSTGDFSFGIEGFLIENGKKTMPISEMNVTGNMVKLWSSLKEIGNDARQDSSWRIPSLVFEDVEFSGL